MQLGNYKANMCGTLPHWATVFCHRVTQSQRRWSQGVSVGTSRGSSKFRHRCTWHADVRQTQTSQHHRFVPLGGGVISRNLYSSICSSYSSEGKGRHGSFQLRMNAWVCRENWDRLRTRAIPERFWGDDSRRSAISSVRTFTYLPFSVYSLCMCLSVCTTLCVCVCLVCACVCVLQCVRRYQRALTLLHSLQQQTDDNADLLHLSQCQ